MPEDSKFGLADCLKELRQDLITTVDDGKGEDLKFIVDDIALELQIVASTGGKGGGGVKWWILSAEASAEISNSVTQKLALKLKVVGKDGNPVPMSATTS